MLWPALLALIPPLLLFLTAPQSPQMFGKSVRHVKTHEKIVALTFDDGPSPACTPAMLDVLKEHEVKATFFVIGQRAAQHPEMVKSIYTAGHEIGNHSWSHQLLIWCSPQEVRDEITKTDEIIRRCGYTGSIPFRCPHGRRLVIAPWVLKDMKRTNILFDVYAWDWTNPGTEYIVKKVLSNVSPGSIILLHDGCGTPQHTIAAANQIITQLKARGYRFATVSELLALKKIPVTG